MSGRGYKKNLLILSMVMFTVFIASATPNKSSNTFDKLIVTLTEKVDEWNRMAYMSLALILISGISGLVVSTIQQMKGTWVKTTTIALGIVIGASVLVNNAICEYDYKTLKYYVNKGIDIIDKIKLYTYDYNKCSTKQNREAIQNKIMSLSEQIYKIDDIIYKKPGSDETLAEGFVLENRLYAENANQAKPDWIDNPPTNSETKFFVGKAADILLENAEKKSYIQAVQQAREYIRQTIIKDGVNRDSIKPELIDKIIVKTCLKESYYFEMSPDHNYVYYTLLKIRLETLKSYLTIYL